MRLFRYYRYDLVSLILLLLFVAGGIGAIREGYSIGGLLFIAALFNVYMVRERGLFIDKVQHHLKDSPNKLFVLGIPVLPPYPKRKNNWFEIIVKCIIFAGSLLVITLVIISIIRG